MSSPAVNNDEPMSSEEKTQEFEGVEMALAGEAPVVSRVEILRYRFPSYYCSSLNLSRETPSALLSNNDFSFN